MATITIWPGSSSFSDTTNPTPFGFYDSDSEFQTNADKVATWCAQRLGYPIVDIELQAVNFYTAFEESVTTYAQYVYESDIQENMSTLLGNDIGEVGDLNSAYVQPNLGNIISLAEKYGTEVGSGGNVKYKKGSIDISAGTQEYSLQSLYGDVSESGHFMQIQKVYHYAPAAISRYFDPYAGTGTGIQSLMETFGFGNYSPGVNFMLMPTYYDVLKIQAIEFNDQIRKSAYSFEIMNNDQLRIYPIPKRNETLYFDYFLKKDRDNPVRDTNPNLITDVSNVPYTTIEYNSINSPGRQWIARYTLAVTKEMLASVRGKYSTVPIPGSEVTTNASDLRSEAASEKQALVEELKLLLEEASRSKYMEREAAIAQQTQELLTKVPYPIYIY
jgi:hypothetical protein